MGADGDDMHEHPLRVDISAGTATLTLNRAQAGNAIDLPTAEALVAAAVRCEADESIRCVVLTGVGRLFCGGGDMAALAAAGDHLPEVLSELVGALHTAVSKLMRMRKPLLVLVNGPAAGAGLSLAVMGDVVLAVRSAHFSAAYGAVGLTADGGLSWHLPRLIGLRRAQEMMLTNRRVTAEEAAEMGLVTRVVDDDALTSEGAALAQRLAGSATLAIGGARTLLLESFGGGLEAQLDREARSMIRAGATRDGREGIAAFLARRKPVFAGN